ncbi:MAG TPA: UvrD-helicase domain-containing protein [Steroidobacteraceae bacterium]|nr:UvrD-helicase domain-containing protein [Steroidobacteraceae bacterium]
MTDLAAMDAAARERALDIGRSFIVQAPAGSGKTTVLTQRYLKLLASVDQPEQVLAITFTRKAAGEMRERVQKALAVAGENHGIGARSPAEALTLELAAAARANAERRGWGIEDSAARLRIQTIDAFNGYLANALPITSRNGFGRGIADDPADLYALAARETLRAAESDPDQRRDLERILRRLDDNWMRLERLIAGMLPRRAEWLPNLPQLSGEPLVPRIEKSLHEIVSEELAHAASVFSADFITQASALARFAAQHVDAKAQPDLAAWRHLAGSLSPLVTHLPLWRGIALLALTDKGTPRKMLTKNEGIPTGDRVGKVLRDDWLERLRLIDAPQVKALALIAMLPDPLIPADARDALDSLSRLLLHAAATLRTLFDQHGECDHTEIAGAARQALTQDSSPTPLAERIGTHLRHILIDEFQDTSRDQYELLRTLTQDWSDGDGRTLFLVGDPMQSIYGFRNAEVGRFATVRAAGLAGLKLESLTLRRNFRSAPTLVHWCNETFARVFPDADDVRRSAVPHLASVAGRADMEGDSRLYRVGGDCGPQAEADHVAALIEEIRRSRPDDSIAVLAGARPHLRGVRGSLHARGIPFIGVNLEPLADVAVVRDLEALVRALESPLDRVAWLAVLRAPFVGLMLPDLTLVSDAAGEGTVASALMTNIPGLTPDGAQRLMRARPVLLGGWHERERENRAHLVERTWLALGGASACAHEGELLQARRFLAALDDEDRKRLRGRPLDLGAVMDRLYAVDPAQPGAVSLMTIHGAKGLEFDHVFVVGVGRRGRGDDSRLLNWLELPRGEGPDHLLMAPVRYRGADEESDDAINGYLALLHRERARAERTRLAYVALTRAKRSLHLFAHPIAKDVDGEPVYRAGSGTLLDNLWPALEAGVAAFTAIDGVLDGASDDIGPAKTQTRMRLPGQFVSPAPPPDVLARGELVPLGPEEEDIEFSWARQTARRVGTVVHEALERFGRGRLPSLAELPAWRPRLISRLEALGVETERAQAGAEQALRAIAATLSDQRGRWLFDPAHTEASSELALSGVRGSEIVNVIIDRTFVDAGTRWVVDFKTSPHEGGDVENFLDEEVKRYRGQLQRYAHFARGLGPHPVRAGLYYPLLGAWREVPV